jgi:hypothetical protein
MSMESSSSLCAPNPRADYRQEVRLPQLHGLAVVQDGSSAELAVAFLRRELSAPFEREEDVPMGAVVVRGNVPGIEVLRVRPCEHIA